MGIRVSPCIQRLGKSAKDGKEKSLSSLITLKMCALRM